MSWNDSIRILQTNDVRSYSRIAEAAPGYPRGEPVLAIHHGQRLVPHYFVGMVAKATGLRLPSVYSGLACIFLMLLLWECSAALRALSLTEFWRNILMGVIVTNPYLIRYYTLAPGMLQDVVYFYGGVLALRGLFSGQILFVCCGLCLGALGRPNAMLMVPGVLWWMIHGEAWRGLSRGSRLWMSVATCAAVFLPLLFTLKVAERFSAPMLSQHELLGVLSWLHSDAFSLPLLALNWARILLPYATVFAVMAAVVLGSPQGRRGFSGEDEALLVMWATSLLQLALVNANFLSMNGTRHGTYGVLFFWLFLARRVAVLGEVVSARSSTAASILGLLGVGSFHHLYSWSPVASAGPFAIMCAVSALAASTLLARQVFVESSSR